MVMKMSSTGRIGWVLWVIGVTAGVVGAQERPLNVPPEGFTALFNGTDLTGWKGLVGDPKSRAKMSPEQLAAAQAKADDDMRAHWKVADGALEFDGKGHSLCTAKDYGDFEMWVDWKIEAGGDSGIYLRGSPQVQIWDTARTDSGAQVGSGGLYNNQKHPSKPAKVADKPVGQWNTFQIFMVGEKVTVILNGEIVVDNVVMENYWERDKPIYPTGQIELQSHGSRLYFRNIYIREIPREQGTNTLTDQEKAEGFELLFNGKDMSGWVGGVAGYRVEDGVMICDPLRGGGGNVYTQGEYGDFVLRFDFRLTPGANNGLGIRAPLEGNAAYVAMELQILDDTSPRYRGWLKDWQHHGSIYGVVAAQPGHLRPVGLWNCQEVIAKGRQITVKLNGQTIVDADIEKASTPKTIDGQDHGGLLRPSGHIGFLGHGDQVEFRNLRVKRLD